MSRPGLSNQGAVVGQPGREHLRSTQTPAWRRKEPGPVVSGVLEAGSSLEPIGLKGFPRTRRAGRPPLGATGPRAHRAQSRPGGVRIDGTTRHRVSSGARFSGFRPSRPQVTWWPAVSPWCAGVPLGRERPVPPAGQRREASSPIVRASRSLVLCVPARGTSPGKRPPPRDGCPAPGDRPPEPSRHAVQPAP